MLELAIPQISYRQSSLEPFDPIITIHNNVESWECEAGNAKDPTKTIEDLQKAKWYLEREIKNREIIEIKKFGENK